MLQALLHPYTKGIVDAILKAIEEMETAVHDNYEIIAVKLSTKKGN